MINYVYIYIYTYKYFNLGITYYIFEFVTDIRSFVCG